MNVSLIEEKKTNQKMKFQTEYFSNYDRYLQYVGRISYADLLAIKSIVSSLRSQATRQWTSVSRKIRSLVVLY